MMSAEPCEDVLTSAVTVAVLLEVVVEHLVVRDADPSSMILDVACWLDCEFLNAILLWSGSQLNDLSFFCFLD